MIPKETRHMTTHNLNGRKGGGVSRPIMTGGSLPEGNSTSSPASTLATLSQELIQQPILNLNHRSNGSGCVNESMDHRRRNNKGPPLTSRGAPTPGTHRARGRTRRRQPFTPGCRRPRGICHIRKKEGRTSANRWKDDTTTPASEGQPHPLRPLAPGPQRP